MNTVPNWTNILLIIFASVIVVSFIVFIYTAIIENEKINFISIPKRWKPSISIEGGNRFFLKFWLKCYLSLDFTKSL